MSLKEYSLRSLSPPPSPPSPPHPFRYRYTGAQEETEGKKIVHLHALIITHAYTTSRDIVPVSRDHFQTISDTRNFALARKKKNKKKTGTRAAKRTADVTKGIIDISRDENIAYQTNYM